jgi:2-polyprenyl-3-methyl-5-hydroxy-6-metoxy-1,4-benzoquinol methylase
MHISYKSKKKEYYALDRSEMLKYIPLKSKTFLDVGCGTGEFAARVKAARGAMVWGVELNAEAATIAKDKLDRVLVQNFEEGIDLNNAKFDCIIFNDVLEHMYDPWSALHVARKHLTPTGVVVASIPNVKFFRTLWDLIVHDQWEYVDSGILDRTHIRFFTKSGVRKLFNDAGFVVQKIEGINQRKLGRKYMVLNTLLLNRLSDMKYLQFAVVATPIHS